MHQTILHSTLPSVSASNISLVHYDEHLLFFNDVIITIKTIQDKLNIRLIIILVINAML